MHNYIDNLSYSLRLTQYQSEMLNKNSNEYNMGRVIKRGGVIYVPYMSRGFIDWVIKLFYGVRADLIGQNKILVKNKRNIKFYKNGFYRIKLGRFVYYADAMGRGISRNAFLRGIAD